MAKIKIKKKKVAAITGAALELGVATGILLALERHGIKPFDGGRGCTYGDFKKMLKSEYLVDINEHDFEAIMGFFNSHPMTKVQMRNTGVSIHHAEPSDTPH